MPRLSALRGGGRACCALVLGCLVVIAAGCSTSTFRGTGRTSRGHGTLAGNPVGNPVGGVLPERTAGLPGSKGVGSAAVVAGRFVRGVVVGGLSVSPLSGGGARPLMLSSSLAAAYVGITGGLASGRRLVGYGSVTLRGVSLPAGTPPLIGRPAWVGIAYASTRPVAYSCPAMVSGTPPGSSGAPQPIDTAVVFYGNGGDGAVLYSTGGSLPCGGTAKPAVSPADGLVSVPWQQAGPVGLSTRISYVVPSCASLSGVDAGGNVNTGIYKVDVTVAIPFDRAGCKSVVTRTTTVNVYPPDAGPGAPPPPSSVILEHSSLPELAPQGFRPPGFEEP